ncbi:heavy-metal-associated domain-containing protein [Gracilimonas sediminicola]|uniref:Heavy-metal-associated domain-containing protein n=1 Tax=Gracilimonas sediminicola TaxID=2952158 RepID=A0A9X2L1W2_9BACT|nr:heavy-metal-associated domain-containing protein [Gracilimonas sediminicola]MCP9290553.1 heavy-metal-associated domain-containing protein [Gracilimonas sediminicola]
MKKLILLLLTLILSLPITANAQLLKVEQTVFGMDCAPCAYGLEKRIHKLDGVAKANVSLNKGLLEIFLLENNSLTLSVIRDAVKDSGFEPQSAEITAKGVLRKDNEGRFVLNVSEQSQLLLHHDSSLFNKLNEMIGKSIVVSGEIGEDSNSKLNVLTYTLNE